MLTLHFQEILNRPTKQSNQLWATVGHVERDTPNEAHPGL